MTAVGLLALALSLGPAVVAPADEPDSLSRLALERALGAFSDAFLRADAEVLDTLLVPDYESPGWVLTGGRWLRAAFHDSPLPPP